MGKYAIFEKKKKYTYSSDNEIRHVYILRAFDEQHGIETIRQAIRSGINYIDTAPYYGQGRSEQILGKALKGVPREAYYIATKVGRYDVAPNKQFDFSYERTMKSVDVSLDYLGLDYVDLIQVSATYYYQ